MTTNNSNVISLLYVTAECVAWSAIDMERKGVKMKKIQSHIRLSVYDCVNIGFSRSMRCKELSTILQPVFCQYARLEHEEANNHSNKRSMGFEQSPG